MKKIFALIMMLPLFAFAGPEDYTPGAVYRSTQKAPLAVSEFVFDTAKISADGNALVLEARYGNLFGSFPIVRTSRHNEDRVNFVAEKIILSKYEGGCGSNEVAKITIRGEESVGVVDAASLELTVNYSTMENVCKGPAVTQVFRYELIK